MSLKGGKHESKHSAPSIKLPLDEGERGTDSDNQQRPHFEGMLVLKTGNPFSRRWVKRWFVLDGNQIHCFINQADKCAINTVYFREAEIYTKSKKKEIELKFANHRTYQFRAHTSSSYDAWVVAFNRGKNFKGSNLQTIPRTHSSESFLEGDSENEDDFDSEFESENLAMSGNGTLGVATRHHQRRRTNSMSGSTRGSISLSPVGARKNSNVDGNNASDMIASHSGMLTSFSELMSENVDHSAVLSELSVPQAKQAMEKALSSRANVLEEVKQIESTISGLVQERKLVAASSGDTVNAEGELDSRLEAFRNHTKDMFAALSSFASHMEGEYHEWNKRLAAERKRRHAFEEALKNLAEEHLMLERKASICMNGLDLPCSEDEEEDEFFDAVSERRKSIFDLDKTSSSSVEEREHERTRSSSIALLENFERRRCLPCDKSDKKISIWGFLKKNIGKDLSKISMPIILNEPLTSNQRFAEDLEYPYLLDKGAEAMTSQERMIYVAAFAITTYSTTINRIGKPFNPMLGETYELKRRDKGYTLFSEQVSHHPPIVAMHADADSGSWQFYQDVNVKSQFRAKDMLIKQLGSSHVVFPKFNNEHYSWAKANTCIHNLIVGKLWIDHVGDVIITNHTTGDVCSLKFKPYGFFGGVLGQVEGVITDKNGTSHYKLQGKWTDSMSFCPVAQPDKAKVVWRRNDLPPESDAQYNMTQFAMTLNELEPGHRSKLPPTDSRFRPDQRLYEDGHLDRAQDMKTMLEEKQRAARRMREAKGETWTPRWFELRNQADTGLSVWERRGDLYWEERSKQKWNEYPDIFTIPDVYSIDRRESTMIPEADESQTAKN
eukprot:Nk52_evm39s158 gene=Nk52_evmTU39s158